MRGGTIESFDLDDYLGRANWPKTHPAGRVCVHDGCDTILSVFNPEDWCGAHVPEPPMRYCGYDVAVCASCGEATALKRRGAKPSRACGFCGAQR